MKSPGLMAVALVLAAGGVLAADGKAPPPTKDRTELGSAVLNVSDLKKSVDYYKLIGFDVVNSREGNDPRVQLNFRSAEGHFSGGISLHQSKEKLVQGNAFGRLILVVADVKGLCAKLAANKMPCATEPRLVPGDGNSLIGRTKDPDGFELELIQPPR